ncbi:MAG: hypothetical protein ACRCT6_06585, partial [Notoacmeibacter sp.]
AAFVNIHSFTGTDAALDYIVALNNDVEKLLGMLNASPLKSEAKFQGYRQKLRVFLEHIFDQTLWDARRRPRAGFAANLEKRRRKDELGHRKWYHRNRV